MLEEKLEIFLKSLKRFKIQTRTNVPFQGK